MIRLQDLKDRYKLIRHQFRVIYRTYFTSEDPEKSILSDRLYLKDLYRRKIGKKLNLRNPKTFNEKMQWLKLYDRRPYYTAWVDKYAVKDYISKKIGEEYVIPTFGVYNDPDDIDFDVLPEQFILKCTHSSGIGTCICRNKADLNIDEVKKNLRIGLENDYYLGEREWPYKNVPRRIICEKFMVDESGTGLIDYKFFCFDGEPKMLFVRSGSGAVHYADFYDMDFTHLPIRRMGEYLNSKETIPKPQNLDKMIDIARKLSKGLPYIRVDLYDIKGKIYFGELTLYSGGGMLPFYPEEWDGILGSWLKLPEKKIKAK